MPDLRHAERQGNIVGGGITVFIFGVAVVGPRLAGIIVASGVALLLCVIDSPESPNA